MVKKQAQNCNETWSIEKINRALGAEHLPIAQQQAIIRAGYENGAEFGGLKPMLVIAGAGSGKTETMSQRVVYLIANRFVKPDEILGLTFTKKAVCEFRERIGQRLQKLSDNAPEIESYFADLEDYEGIQISDINISTYNGFAQDIVKKYGSYLGYSENIKVITEAYAWQIMYQVVEEYTGEISLDLKVPTVAEKALALAGQLNEHLLSAKEAEEQMQAMLAQMRDFRVKGNSKAPSKSLKELLEKLELRLQLLEIVKVYQERKGLLGVIDYSDQVRIAYQLVQKYPAIKAEINDRYKTIFLDEFQDTSAAQMLLLESLFKGKAVIAVGDPNQSIYAWRGASELSMQGFMDKFSEETEHNHCYYPISYTFRNRAKILDVANTLIGAEETQSEGEADSLHTSKDYQPKPMTYSRWEDSNFGEEFLPEAPPLQVQRITPFFATQAESQGEEIDYADMGQILSAASGVVETYFEDSDLQEAALVADRCAQVLDVREQERLAGRKETDLPTAAILVRAHSQVPALVEALENKNIPYQVVGTAGLLYHPAVLELVAALSVSADAGDGSALIRLLMGAGVGLADIAVLGDWAAEIAKRQERQTQALLKEEKECSETERNPESDSGVNIPASGEARKLDREENFFELQNRTPILLIDAIDNPPPLDWQAKTGNTLSTAGRQKVQRLAKILYSLRQEISRPLDSLINKAIKLLNLDIDIMLLNPAAAENAKQALKNLLEVAKEYITNVENPSLASFLSWLTVAEEQERGLSLPGVTANPNAVQILTIHAAKGLEWTMVAVVGLDYPLSRPQNGRLPSVERSTKGIVASSAWINDAGELPYELRKDRDILPQLRGFSPEMSFSEALKQVEAYKATLGELKTIEDRRLAYVAVTRAKQYLLIGGAAGKEDSESLRAPSSFLREIDPEKMEPIFAELSQLNETHKAEKKAAKNSPDTLPNFQYRQERDNDFQWPYQNLENYPVPSSIRDYGQWPPVESENQRRFLRICTQIQTVDRQVFDEDPDIRALAEIAQKDLSAARRQELLEEFAGREEWLEKIAQLFADYGARLEEYPVYLPARLAATAAKKLLVDRSAFLQDLRRPMPFNIGVGGLIGTAVHQWIDTQLKGESTAAENDYLPEVEKATFAKLKQHWLNMQILREWEYIESETAYQDNIGVTVSAKIDAVMRRKADGKIFIIDWKTDHYQENSRGVIIQPSRDTRRGYFAQLHQYRLLWAKYHQQDWREIGIALAFIGAEKLVESSTEGEFDFPDSLKIS